MKLKILGCSSLRLGCNAHLSRFMVIPIQEMIIDKDGESCDFGGINNDVANLIMPLMGEIESEVRQIISTSHDFGMKGGQ